MFQGGRSSRPGQAWVPPDKPGTGSETPSRNAELAVARAANGSLFGAKASATRREREARGDNGSEKIAVTRSTFCRFVEGKRFDCSVSIEGFLRTLSGTGRLLTTHGGGGTAAAAEEEEGTPLGQVPFCATTARRGIPSAEERPSGSVGAARWGARGLRRASSQFAHDLSPPTKRYSTADSPTTTTATHGGSPGRTSPMTVAQTHVGVARSSLSAATAAGVRGAGGASGGSSARSRGAAGHPSSRSGTSATPRSAASSGGFLGTPRGGVRGRGFVAEGLLSLHDSESGTMSSAEFISAANRVTGLPVRQEWAEVLATRFAAGAQEVYSKGGASRAGSVWGSGGGVRWLGGGEEGKKSSRLDVVALVDFLRPKSFSLSVMTPFGKDSRQTIREGWRINA